MLVFCGFEKVRVAGKFCAEGLVAGEVFRRVGGCGGVGFGKVADIAGVRMGGLVRERG